MLEPNHERRTQLNGEKDNLGNTELKQHEGHATPNRDLLADPVHGGESNEDQCHDTTQGYYSQNDRHIIQASRRVEEHGDMDEYKKL